MPTKGTVQGRSADPRGRGWSDTDLTSANQTQHALVCGALTDPNNFLHIWVAFHYCEIPRQFAVKLPKVRGKTAKVCTASGQGPALPARSIVSRGYETKK